MGELPSVFDYDTYVSVSKSIGFFWFAWQIPGESGVRVERQYPSRLGATGQKRLEQLHEWANRTDPDLSLRMAEIRRQWNSRPAGADVVSPFWRK